MRTLSAPPGLETRIRCGIREQQKRATIWNARLIGAAATAALFVGIGIAYQLGHLRLTRGSQDSYISSVSNRISSIMRVGLRDHIHCSVFRKYPKDAPSISHLNETLGPEYSALIPVVNSHVPNDYRMMLAHKCSYQRRRFIHLSLMKGSSLISLVIAKKGEGESFETERLVPALTQANVPFYRSVAQRFQISAFETRDYLVYLISDLPEQQNTNIMIAMAPQVAAVLSKLEL
jgi:hypothetical protein